MSDWRAALADPKRNPLKRCDDKAIAHFTKNLKFTNGGLGHADYSAVASQLNYGEFVELWGIFGLGMGLFNDHDGYACQGKGTCTKMNEKICTSNC